MTVSAAALTAGSFASYASVKRHLDTFASDGDADVTKGDFEAIVLRVRVVAALALLAAAAIFATRVRLARFIAALGASAVVASAALARSLRRAVANESRLHLGALGVVTLAALLVRLEFLFQPMRYDESVTFVSYASTPWYIAVSDYTAPNNHVLHSLLAHISIVFFGVEPWAVRLPALVAGVLLVPGSYIAARALYGKRVAIVTAGLVAGSSLLVEYSTNARGYTLLALVFVLLLALATHLTSSWNLAAWLAFAALGAIGFYTVPVMLYAFGVVVAWLTLSLWRRERRLLTRRLLPAVVTTGIVTVVLYAPIIASSGLGAITDNEYVRPLGWRTLASELPDSLVAVAKQWHRDVPWPLALVFAAACVTAMVYHRRLSRFAVSPGLAALAWIVPVVLAQRVVPFERVWLFLLPLYLMTAAAGGLFVLRPLAHRAGPDMLAVVLGVVAAGSLGANAVATQAVYDSEQTSTFRDGELVAELVASRLEPGTAVLVAPPADAVLEYQLHRRGIDPTPLLYWRDAGSTRRLLVVVKEGRDDYSLEEILEDTRLAGRRWGEPRLIRRYDEAAVYELGGPG